jgi:CBS domain-containing protein
MKCAEIMTVNPKMCVPDNEIAVAAGLMWDYDCGIIPVVKDVESKELVGIVTDRDIAMHVVKHAYKHPCEVKVNDCMSVNVISCLSEDPIESALSAMGAYHFRRIPIVDEKGSCVGIISITDLLSHAENMEQDVISMMKQVCSRCSETPTETSEEATAEDVKVEKETTGD